MKNNGLKNRFSQKVRYQWLYWYDCIYCGKNKWDCLHHLISGSLPHIYKEGKFNESVLNSCPIHNFGCHLYNHDLHEEEKLKELLLKVFYALKSMNYQLKEIDYEFIRQYKTLYPENLERRSDVPTDKF